MLRGGLRGGLRGELRGGRQAAPGTGQRAGPGGEQRDELSSENYASISAHPPENELAEDRSTLKLDPENLGNLESPDSVGNPGILVTTEARTSEKQAIESTTTTEERLQQIADMAARLSKNTAPEIDDELKKNHSDWLSAPRATSPTRANSTALARHKHRHGALSRCPSHRSNALQQPSKSGRTTTTRRPIRRSYYPLKQGTTERRSRKPRSPTRPGKSIPSPSSNRQKDGRGTAITANPSPKSWIHQKRKTTNYRHHHGADGRGHISH